MNTHDRFVSIYIYMPLNDRNWLCQNVVASTDQIDKEHRMIPHDAKDPFIVVHGFLWRKSDDYSCRRMSIYGSLNFGKREDILRIVDELEVSWQR